MRHHTAPVKRDYSFDNIRFLLIFLVVFAHLLEIVAPFDGKNLIYQVIYSFHMPAFLFLLGYYVNYSPKRIVFRWAVPYLIFQSLYLLFAGNVLGSSASWQYTTPYWLLWYLLAGVFYQLLIPLYDVKSKAGQAAVLTVCVAMALLAGLDKSVGYYLSLSRFFVFQPWFVLGFYCRKHAVPEKLSGGKWYWPITILSTVLVAVSVLALPVLKLPNNLLYGSYAYSASNGTLWMRAVTMGMAFGWLLYLFVAMKPLLNRPIPCITSIGQNTLPIFLLHGFVVRAVAMFFPVLRSSVWHILLLTCVILPVFGNRFCRKAVDGISLSWLENRLG